MGGLTNYLETTPLVALPSVTWDQETGQRFTPITICHPVLESKRSLFHSQGWLDGESLDEQREGSGRMSQVTVSARVVVRKG